MTDAAVRHSRQTDPIAGPSRTRWRTKYRLLKPQREMRWECCDANSRKTQYCASDSAYRFNWPAKTLLKSAFGTGGYVRWSIQLSIISRAVPLALVIA